jgi:transcriptional regulator of acetoin/glycerol metabolism
MEEVERRHILHVLRAVGGNKVAAAGVLGFDRSTLYRKLEHFGLSVSLAGAKD